MKHGSRPAAQGQPNSNHHDAAAARSFAWDDFRLINAVAEARTLPAAALLLGVDHSTVFRRLRQIEAGLATPIFERHRSGYALTAAGEEIAALAARVDEDITAVLRRVAGQSPSPAGEVRVATSDALLFGLLMPLFAEFRSVCPDIRLDLVAGNLALNLSRRDADVAIRATSSPPETLVGRNVGRLAWAAYAPSGLASPNLSTPEPFAGSDPWVGFGDALSSLAAAAHLRANVAESRIACRLDGVNGLAAAAEAGIGRAILPCFLGDTRPKLARLTPPLPALASDLWLLTHADLRHVPRIRALLDFLGERLAAKRALLEGREPAG